MYSEVLVLLFLVTTGSFCLPVIDEYENSEPFFNPESDLRFLLFTRENRAGQNIRFNDIGSVRESTYNRTRGLRVILHGWGDTAEGNLVRVTTDAYLRNNDLNILAVDYSRAGTINYLAVVRRVPEIGRVTANLLDMLHENGELDYNNVGMVGVSLGAHIIGHTGKEVRRGKIDTLIGLDPAGPLFNLPNPDGRLDAGDAKYVEVIHTNIGVYGLGGLTGTTNFFVNGGSSQPGCTMNNCSHMRSASLFIESLNSDRLVARTCETLDDARKSRCTGGPPGVNLGGEPSNSRHNLTGIFHLATNRNSPFGMGPI